MRTLIRPSSSPSSAGTSLPRSAVSASAHRPLIVGRILLYADDFVGGWLEDRMGVRLVPPYTSFGMIGPDGLLAGAMIFNGFNEGNAEVSIYAPRAVSRGSLRAAASYVFETNGCNRLTARTRASSLSVRRFIDKVGFQQEGVLRAYYQDGEDAILYGLLRSECRWLSHQNPRAPA